MGFRTVSQKIIHRYDEISAGFEWPNASNTGWSGSLTTNASSSFSPSAGQTITGVNFTGVAINLSSTAHNVTFRNCRINSAAYWGIDCSAGSQNLQIIDCEFIGNGSSAAVLGNVGACTLIQRCNIHGSEDGLKGDGGMVVDSCWIHDLYTTGSSHNDGIQLQSYSDFTATNNWIESPDTSCIILGGGESRPPCSNILIQHNWFVGGGYEFYGPYGGSVTPPGPSSYVRVLDNYFSTVVHPNGGLYGPNTQWEDGTGNVWSGNVWADGPNAGLPVAASYY